MSADHHTWEDGCASSTTDSNAVDYQRGPSTDSSARRM
jgi:hypothetical protein